MNPESNVVDLAHLNPKHSASSVDPTLAEAFHLVVAYLGRNDDLTESDKANYADTAIRAAKAFASLTKTRTEIHASLTEILATGFPAEDSEDAPGPVSQGPIGAHSLCPHHLLQVEYEAYVAYMPKMGGNVLGLSKLARVTEELAHRPVLQEQLARDIADCLHGGNRKTGLPGIESEGSAVMLVGRHNCMSCRGVRSNALTQVLEIRGVFRNPGMEAKFIQAVTELRTSNLRR